LVRSSRAAATARATAVTEPTTTTETKPETITSLEIIDALLSLSNIEDLGRMALYRLRLDDGTLKSVRLNGEEISFSRMTIEDDLR
jgi:uncharacterized membrane protein